VTEAVRIGVVGCGRLAERGYVPALRTVPGLHLAAVADPDDGRRTHLAGEASTQLGHVVAAYDGIDGLLAAERLDAVVISSPVGSHVAGARTAAAAGVPALVEKPPAPDLAGAVELAGLSPRPWLGFNRRFDAGARDVRDAVPPDGELELLLRIHYRRPSWGAHTVRDAALLDLGPHLLDWARWLSGGEIVDVACPELSMERAVLELTLDRGCARLEAATDRPHQELVEVRDGSGHLVARHRTGGVVAGVRARVRGGGPDALVASLRAELAALAAAVRGPASGRDAAAATDLGSPADGVAVMAAVAAARASDAEGGRPVRATLEELS
jgi:myo-inositol 2-dehydrogenase/D-chiro-inositol 1-dehydrogenase